MRRFIRVDELRIGLECEARNALAKWERAVVTRVYGERLAQVGVVTHFGDVLYYGRRKLCELRWR